MEDSRKERVREGEYGEWMRANLLNVGKNGENVLGLARTESEKILRGHRLRKNGEEELREEARRTGRVPKKGDSSRIEGYKRTREDNGNEARTKFTRGSKAEQHGCDCKGSDRL